MQPSLTEKIKQSQIQKGGVTDADRGAWQTQEDHDRRRVSIRFDKISNSID